MSSDSPRSTHLGDNSAQQIDHIGEVMANILSRLPAKTLGACKLVCKNWLGLISDHLVPTLHLYHSRKRPMYAMIPYPWGSGISHLYLMEVYGGIRRSMCIPVFENISTLELTSFSNGLMCGAVVNQDNVLEVSARIFNPITHDCIVIPIGTPSRVAPSVGVVFDPNNNKFKVFRFFTDSSSEDGKFQCEAYTSHSSWRRISDSVDPPKHNCLSPMTARFVSIDGCMYWFAWSENGITPAHIMSVDMDDNFTKIELPTELCLWSFLVELEGCLTVVHVKSRRSNSSSRYRKYVQVFKFKNGEWHLKATSELNLRRFIGFNSVTARNEEVLFIIKRNCSCYCSAIFNLVNSTIQMFDIAGRFDDYGPLAFTFTESLLKCSEM